MVNNFKEKIIIVTIIEFKISDSIYIDNSKKLAIVLEDLLL